ncbi:hypothetical protein CERZMDRAFT_95977 [Cercospora zeae-maydis SCOH1-5]|uniref:F-box domain-containing protein n=1 Tax=Cercospora zeae-maydis SCOH1-5 TaxID=717836 RepID=A0A6A6FKQ2_9PEZI|nr:hypothetical protein CERZMDRAFT_95977 [Cercospora zeae-maydis SCOH1-5]
MLTDAGATTLTDLPPELRVQIFEYILQDPQVSVTCLEGGRLETKSPWALLLVCRLLRSEIEQMMPEIPSIDFEFSNCNGASMSRWCFRMGQERMLQMKRWTTSGTGVCLTGWDEATNRKADAPPCLRSITVDMMSGYLHSANTECSGSACFDIDTRCPVYWSALDAISADSFCARGCVACEYCTSVIAVGQLSKMQWNDEIKPLPTAQLLVSLANTAARDLSKFMCPRGCGIEGCDQHRGGQDPMHLWRMVNFNDFKKQYVLETR